MWNSLLNLVIGKSKDEKASVNASSASAMVNDYRNRYDVADNDKKENADKTAARMANAVTNAETYYNLTTDFYEYGWGQCFHFAMSYPGEPFKGSLARHEYFLANKLGLKAGQLVLDVGCGVGGPMRNIALFSSAKVVGVNYNQYQVDRALRLNAEAKISHLTDVVRGDFMKLPFDDNTFDNCYAIEATCHAADRVGCFSQMYRCVKPGGMFAVYEWGMTDKYDEKNEEHRRIKHGIEEGNGLPTLIRNGEILEAARKAGFEVVEEFDVAVDSKRNGFSVDWYQPLKGGWTNPSSTKIGRWITHKFCVVMEWLKIAPKGTVSTSQMLVSTADDLVLGAELGIFTPMYFMLLRKKK